MLINVLNGLVVSSRLLVVVVVLCDVVYGRVMVLGVMNIRSIS